MQIVVIMLVMHLMTAVTSHNFYDKQSINVWTRAGANIVQIKKNLSENVCKKRLHASKVARGREEKCFDPLRIPADRAGSDCPSYAIFHVAQSLQHAFHAIA